MDAQDFVHALMDGATFKNYSKNSLWFQSKDGGVFNLPKSQIKTVTTPEGDVGPNHVVEGSLIHSVEIPRWLAEKKEMEIINDYQ